MSFYETVFIARQDISTKQVEDFAKNFGQIVNDNGGSVKRTESWGLRTLAYKIKKNRKGHYVMLQFEGNGATVSELERLLKLNEDILRFMTVSLEKIPADASVMMRGEDTRNDDREDGEAA